MEATELIIVIPAYEPDYLLPELIDKLNEYFTGHQMIVINDGSKGKDELFEQVKNKENVTLLTHEVNRGKGAALKTAFAYIKTLGESYVIVTADSDGQHKPEDIYRVYNFYKKYNQGLVLGSRKFDGDIPARSAFGNNCARFLLQMCNGIRLNDTQTGLRAFGSDLIPFLLSIKGDRYEYEMDMLALASKRSIPIHEIAIETIYINNNASSHFRPVRDFTRICSVILKHTLPLFISLFFYILGFVFLYLQFKNHEALKEYRFGIGIVASGIFALFIHYVMNALNICNGNRYVYKNKRSCIYYIFGSLLLTEITLGISYMLWYLTKLSVLAFILGIVISFVLLILEVYIFALKSKLYEE
jgi:glycosyltransferase involved in cell wall biosynthesis